MNPQAGHFELVNGKNDAGEHIFSVIVKRSYRIEHKKPLIRLSQDSEIRKIDHYYDDADPQVSTVQFESEMAPHKKAVDLVIIGSAYAKNGKATETSTVGVRVGKAKKLVSVIGDRECIYRSDMSPEFTDPVPFTRMRVRYERAYGGSDTVSDPELPFFYPRNMQGCGVVLRNTPDSVNGLKLPNFEDPEQVLSPDNIIIEDPKRWPDMPVPQGLGWYQRTWYPRSALIGAYPSFVDIGVATPEERAGLLPKDHIAKAIQFKLPSFHSSFSNGASSGLKFSEIKPKEKIELRGLTPDGTLDFSLPGDLPTVSLDIGKGETSLKPVLDTISIRSDDLEVDLLWRATLKFEGYSWFPKMTRLHAEVQ